MVINRLTTENIHDILASKVLNVNTYRWDKVTQQWFVELQDCHFIADSKYIVKHDKIIYDNQWYIDNYNPNIYRNNQFEYCINCLVDDQYSRKAIIYMGNPEGNSICTISMQMLLDNNMLNWIVNMRSNSVIKYTTDYQWQLSWMQRARNELCVRLNTCINFGTMFWNASSMHIYQEDFKYI